MPVGCGHAPMARLRISNSTRMLPEQESYTVRRQDDIYRLINPLGTSRRRGRGSGTRRESGTLLAM